MSAFLRLGYQRSYCCAEFVVCHAGRGREVIPADQIATVDDVVWWDPQDWVVEPAMLGQGCVVDECAARFLGMTTRTRSATSMPLASIRWIVLADGTYRAALPEMVASAMVDACTASNPVAPTGQDIQALLLKLL